MNSSRTAFPCILHTADRLAVPCSGEVVATTTIRSSRRQMRSGFSYTTTCSTTVVRRPISSSRRPPTHRSTSRRTARCRRPSCAIRSGGSATIPRSRCGTPATSAGPGRTTWTSRQVRSVRLLLERRDYRAMPCVCVFFGGVRRVSAFLSSVLILNCLHLSFLHFPQACTSCG